MKLFSLTFSYLEAIVFTEWSNWSTCSVTCGNGILTRSRTCESGCSSVTASDLTETQACGEGGPCPPTIWVMVSPESSCPSSHKYAYRHGEYCCRTNKEKIASPSHDLCDGSEIGIDSTCCENDDWKRCGNDNCINHEDAFKNGQGKIKNKMIVR